MKKSPDCTARELAAEERLNASAQRPEEADLAADWDLKQSLRNLKPPPLSATFKRRVRRATQRPNTTAWWPALAAAMVLALAIALVLDTRQPEQPVASVSDADLAELRIVLATLDDSLRRTRTITASHLAGSLRSTRVDIADLPYGQQVRSWIQPAQTTHNQGSQP